MKRTKIRTATNAIALLIVANIVLSTTGCANPQGADYIKSRYTKREVRIPLRDGTRLHTAIYAPRNQRKTYPILMRRTPYSCAPYGENDYPDQLAPNPRLLDAGYIFVIQDVRGCYMSEGEFVNMTPHRPVKSTPNDFDESTDTFDTIEWLINNVPNNNGRVGMWGISYPGFYSAAGMIDAHPALRAVSPQAPIADWWYDDFHHHGAFFLSPAFGFSAGFGPRREGLVTEHFKRFDFPTPDGYQFYFDAGPLKNLNERYLHGAIEMWNDMVAHPNYDEYWQSRNILPHLKNVAPAVLTVGGWFDAEDLYGPLKIYESTEAKNPNSDNRLVMGPWRHGGWVRDDGTHLGNIKFGTETSEFYQAQVETPFFEYHLKDRGTLDLPEALVFATGANEWHRFDSWPPRNLRPASLRMAANGRLTLSSTEPATTGPAFDEFISDPAKPVPFTEDIFTGMTIEFMTDDQRFAARRPDVLTYRTDELTEPVTIAGPMMADLWVSTSQSDADWIVKLIDVLPADTPMDQEVTRSTWPKPQALGDYQMLVRADVIRGRYRNSRETPEPFKPNEPTHVRFEMPDVLHTFKPGHRIMVQIQSTWFPLIDRNPQKFVPNIFLANDTDFVKATHRVYRSTQFPSRIEISVLP